MLQDNPASQAACFVIDLLRRKGFQALLAGGCVRDMLLGLDSEDYDVATDARPQQVRALFHRVLMVGAKFGVAIVLYKGQQVEVATFRSDASYSDGRHPDRVIYSDPRQDALRRDFTINGMFYDPIDQEVIDYVGGRQDLSAGIVRTIGNPLDRFEEDYLRMLRGPRFAVRFGYELETDTAAAIRQCAPHIDCISGERIWDELSKMLARDSAARAVELLDRLGLLEHICPPLYQPKRRFSDGLSRMDKLPASADALLRLGALLADLPAGDLRKLTRRWGTSNEIRKALVELARQKNAWQGAPDYPLARFKKLAAGELFDSLMQLWRSEELLRTGQAERTEQIRQRLSKLPPESIDPPALLDGGDLLQMGLEEGPNIGRILREIRDQQLAEQIHTREQALDLAKTRISQTRREEV